MNPIAQIPLAIVMARPLQWACQALIARMRDMVLDWHRRRAGRAEPWGR